MTGDLEVRDGMFADAGAVQPRELVSLYGQKNFPIAAIGEYVYTYGLQYMQGWKVEGGSNLQSSRVDVSNSFDQYGVYMIDYVRKCLCTFDDECAVENIDPRGGLTLVPYKTVIDSQAPQFVARAVLG